MINFAQLLIKAHELGLTDIEFKVDLERHRKSDQIAWKATSLGITTYGHTGGHALQKLVAHFIERRYGAR